jgi:hypothetical protein
MLSRETDADSYKHTRLDYHATVRELPSNERPRERLQHSGPQALSVAELLAIILHTGTRGGNVLDLANKLLSKYGGLPGLVRADFRELCTEHGMGEAKSAQVKAALEIGCRLASVQVDTRYRISTPADAANLVMLDMAYLDTEQIRILLLDARASWSRKRASTRALPTARCCARQRSSVPPSSATALASSSATTTPAATRRPRLRTSRRPGSLWRPAASSTSSSSTTSSSGTSASSA